MSRTVSPSVPLDRLRLGRLLVHALRHYFASMMLASGAKLPEVAHLLGHSSPQLTLKVYAHWLRDEHTTAIPELVSAVCDTQPDARYRRSVSGNRVVT